MGGKCPHRNVKKRRYSHKTHRRDKFLVKDILFFNSEISIFLKKPDEEKKPLPVDEDLPGMGHIIACTASIRYFANVAVRDEHFKTKRHKKRVKQMMGPAPHTQLDADIASGMGMPDNGPKLMSM
ncbi:zinc finger protein 593 [Quercus suber]|uniref:Zinc finger protein 593 n=1 Tax=Quercus suber TaxID=58331 RepID=A0AAW0LYG3_QUESU